MGRYGDTSTARSKRDLEDRHAPPQRRLSTSGCTPGWISPLDDGNCGPRRLEWARDTQGPERETPGDERLEFMSLEQLSEKTGRPLADVRAEAEAVSRA